MSKSRLHHHHGVRVRSGGFGSGARGYRPISYDEHNNSSTEYLLGMPLLPNHLEDGLSQFELEFDA